MNIQRKMIAAVLALVCLTALQVFGQNNAKKKEYTLVGKVEAVNISAGKVTVNHGKVEGWMDAMTMAYPVDKPELLKNVKVGDRIKASVFDGDMMLRNLKVIQPRKPKK